MSSQLFRTTDYWKCLSCVPEYPEFESTAAFKKHLQDVHNVTETKGTRKMILALDGGKGWYHNVFEWQIAGGIKAHQINAGEKRKPK